MLCIELSRNGQRVATAGRPGKGVLSVIFNRVLSDAYGPVERRHFSFGRLDLSTEPNRSLHWGGGDVEVIDEGEIGETLLAARCPLCHEFVIDLVTHTEADAQLRAYAIEVVRLRPIEGHDVRVDPAVPEYIAKDFRTASRVAPISPESAAALYRRALESVLGEMGYDEGKLDERINQAEVDNALGVATVGQLHLVRLVGNYGAHRDEALFVSEGELAHLRAVLGLLFEDSYVRPLQFEAAEKAIYEKLKKAGRDPESWKDRLQKMRKEAAARASGEELDED